MTANRITNFETWLRSVEKRITRLERRPIGSGGGDGGGGGGDVGGGGGLPITEGATGWAGNAVFTSGVANISISNTKQPAGVLAGFNAASGEAAPVTATATMSQVTLRSQITNGSYPVTILFLY